VKVLWRLGKLTPSLSAGRASDLVTPKPTTRRPLLLLWRWGRSLLPKRRKNFTSWRGCLLEKMSLKTTYVHILCSPL